MVVIVIIGVLIGLLVPAVNAVRNTARDTATRAVLATLETGLQTFQADTLVGGDFPPSFSDADGGSGSLPYGLVASPYSGLDGAPSGPIRVAGAGFLVWALAGADGLGTPGFRTFRTANPPISTYWSQDTHDENVDDNPYRSGAYALRDDGRPLQPRSGPYVDTTKIRMSEWDRETGSFEIPAEVDAFAGSGDAPVRPHPMFLDGFGFPVLYWKADPAGIYMVDQGREFSDPTSRGIYHWEDNGRLVDPTHADRLILRAGAPEHRLAMVPEDLSGYPPTAPASFPTYDESISFACYIRNMAVQAALSPQRRDSYLLISPGNDGVYGTGDDITNFQHNSR
jgi:type II secretory pathway pseudopilin PulG